MTSLHSQTEYYQQRFSNNPQFMFIGIFSDAGISGAKENRPGFQAMLEKARAGKIDLIYTKSISRFARNTMMLLQVVRELRSIGVGVIFEEQNINTLRSDGELMLTVLAGIAEEERKSVRTNVQWAMRNKCLRGEVMVNTNRLIGFDKDEFESWLSSHRNYYLKSRFECCRQPVLKHCNPINQLPCELIVVLSKQAALYFQELRHLNYSLALGLALCISFLCFLLQ